MSPLELTLYAIALAIVVYNLLTIVLGLGHKYPNPLPPGPTRLPIIGHLHYIRKYPNLDLMALARKYGPILYLKLGSVDVVVVSSASTAAQFLKVNDLMFASRPSSTGTKYITYDSEDLAFAPYGPRWRMLRKLCSVHLLSGKVVEDFKYVRKGEISELIGEIANARGKAFQLGQGIHICITNNLCRMMLGKKFFNYDTSKNNKDANDFRDMVVECFVLAGAFNICDYLPSLEWLDLQGVTRRMKRVHVKFDRFIGGILDEQKKAIQNEKVGNNNNKNSNNSNSNDGYGSLMSTLINLQDDCDDQGTKLTDTEIKALLVDLFTAGTDTSSSTIEWAMSELIRHPKIRAKVQQELDSVVGPDRLVTESDLAHLPYFRAFIKEVFRLHPVAPLSVPRMAIEACEVNGYHIPKGATLLVNLWAIARDPDVWADPLEFRPERFLPGGERPNADVRGNDFEIIPFGSGRRICIGMNLGIRMVQFMTATLAHAFDFDLADGQSPEKLNMEYNYGLTIQKKVPLLVHPRPRLHAHAYKRL